MKPSEKIKTMFDMLREGDLWTFDDCNWIRDDELDELDSVFINREELKEKIFKSFNKMRVYTKSPNEKQADEQPIVVKPGTIVEDIARTIFGGNLSVITKTRIWGPSSKFGGQEIGLKHELKDKDILEFSTR